MSVELFIGAIYILGLVSFVSVTYDIIANLYEKVKKGKEKRKMGNYIVINGKRINLTDKQTKALSGEEKGVIIRCDEGERFYYIDPYFHLDLVEDERTEDDNAMFEKGNYYPPGQKNLVIQDALHMELASRERKFTRNHGWDEMVWATSEPKWYYGHNMEGDLIVKVTCETKLPNTIYYMTEEILEKAIDEVVRPFIAKHPEFKW